MIDEHYAKQTLDVGVQLILMQKMSSIQPYRRRGFRLEDFDISGCTERRPNLGLRHSHHHMPAFDSVPDSRRKLRIVPQILLLAPRRSIFEPYVDARGAPNQEQRDYCSGGVSVGMHSVGVCSVYGLRRRPYRQLLLHLSNLFGRSDLDLGGRRPFFRRQGDYDSRARGERLALRGRLSPSGASCHRNGLLLPISSRHHHVILRYRHVAHDHLPVSPRERA